MALPLVRRATGASGRSSRFVALIAQAAYHLDELVPLGVALERRGVRSELWVTEPLRTRGGRLRPVVRRQRATIERIDGAIGPAESPPIASCSAVVVMNDWSALTRPIVRAAQAAGTPTFGWVEGAQDFTDAEGPVRRHPYRSVDHVLALGDDSAQYFQDRAVTIVGGRRLWAIWQTSVRGIPDRLAAVNSNFTYRVLEEARRPWLRSVHQACARANMPSVVSQHPAEQALVRPRRTSREPVADLLTTHSVLISRFSTVCFEALVRGVTLAYHNPHGERMGTFVDPRGGFSVTSDTDELASVLSNPARPRAEVRRLAEPFLRQHLRLDGGDPAERAANAVVEALR